MKYELVTIDCGHEYEEPCQVLYESKDFYMIRKLLNGEELPVRKGGVRLFVREVKPKVDLRTLTRYIMQEVNSNSPDNDIVTVSTTWLSIFVDKMVEAGLLEEGGDYEVPS